MFLFHIEIGRKQYTYSHHKPETDTELREAKLNLKGNCRVCGEQIKVKYRRKLCSSVCAALYNKQRVHQRGGRLISSLGYV